MDEIFNVDPPDIELDHSRRTAPPVVRREYKPSDAELLHARQMVARLHEASVPRHKLRIMIDEDTGEPVYVAQCCRLPLGGSMMESEEEFIENLEDEGEDF